MGVRTRHRRKTNTAHTARHKVTKTPLLPPCQGPKLSSFPGTSHTDISFTRLLSDPDSSIHSYVFEVKIKNKVYALKMFRFYSIEQDLVGMNNLQRSLIPEGKLLYHYDPFYAECRAYGRIQERKGAKREIAVPAFGYLMLSPKLEEILEQKFEISEWDRPDEEEDLPVSQKQPFRAIVKRMVYKKNDWSLKAVSGMLQDLLQLRRMGIYNVDIKEGNYAGNQLVDFSLALTDPSLILDTRLKSQAESTMLDDLRGFDEMLEDVDIGPNTDLPSAWKTNLYRKRLRPRNRLVEYHER